MDVDALTIHAAPLRDKSDLLPVCYRCGASNALLNPASSLAHAKHAPRRLHVVRPSFCPELFEL